MHDPCPPDEPEPDTELADAERIAAEISAYMGDSDEYTATVCEDGPRLTIGLHDEEAGGFVEFVSPFDAGNELRNANRKKLSPDALWAALGGF